MSSLTYKKAEPGDLEKIMEVVSDLDQKIQEESRGKIAEKIKSSQLLCAVLDGEIIGFLGWQTDYKDNPEHWYLEQITIKKDQRNKGFGREFVKYFLEVCKNANIKKLFGHIENHNTPSLKMFAAAGATLNPNPDKSMSQETTLEFNF